MAQVIDEPRVSFELIFIEEIDGGDGDIDRSYITVRKTEGGKAKQELLERIVYLAPDDYWKYQVEEYVDDELVETTDLLDWLNENELDVEATDPKTKE